MLVHGNGSREHDMPTENTHQHPEGLSMYPSWYARYLVAFNNQLRCHERVQDLRHSLISEEQRYLDQVSNRVRDFVLAGKHTVRPLVGDSNSPRHQPVVSHPVPAGTNALPKRLPPLRPRQGRAAEPEHIGNAYQTFQSRGKDRRPRRILSPQYPTFCFEELVIRADVERRREARKRKHKPSYVTHLSGSRTVADNHSIPIPLSLMDYSQPPSRSQETLAKTDLGTETRRGARRHPNSPVSPQMRNELVTHQRIDTDVSPRLISRKHIVPVDDHSPVFLESTPANRQRIRDNLPGEGPGMANFTSVVALAPGEDADAICTTTSPYSGIVIQYDDLLCPKGHLLDDSSPSLVCGWEGGRADVRHGTCGNACQDVGSCAMETNGDEARKHPPEKMGEFPEIELVRRWQLAEQGDKTQTVGSRKKGSSHNGRLNKFH